VRLIASSPDTAQASSGSASIHTATWKIEVAATASAAARAWPTHGAPLAACSACSSSVTATLPPTPSMAE